MGVNTRSSLKNDRKIRRLAATYKYHIWDLQKIRTNFYSQLANATVKYAELHNILKAKLTAAKNEEQPGQRLSTEELKRLKELLLTAQCYLKFQTNQVVRDLSSLQFELKEWGRELQALSSA